MTSPSFRRLLAALLLIGWVPILVGCQDSEPSLQSLPAEKVAKGKAASQVASDSQPKSIPDNQAPKIRNVILVVGDGLGPQQLGLLFAYSKLAPNSVVPDRMSAVEQFGRKGNFALVSTNPHGALVVDSAASATQMATGELAGSEMIGANYRGDSVPTVLEIAKNRGKATGLISDTRMTHATPASFAAHQPHRTRENEIAVEMLENRVDVMLSGGLRYFVPQGVNDPNSTTYKEVVQMIGGVYKPSSKRRDNRNLLVEARKDYQLVFNQRDLKEVEQGRVLGLFANSSMDDAISTRDVLESEDRIEPTLEEMTGKALEILSQDPEGFFLMVEAGQIDWCGHNNDTGSMLQELLRMDAAVRKILEWVEGREDTLVIITADHETGSFGFSYSGSPIPEPQDLEGDVFQDDPFTPYFNFASPAVLDDIYSQRRSFFKIFLEFDALPEADQTPEQLMEMVNAAIAPLSITLDDAQEVLKRVPNRQFAAGHPYLGSETFPYIPDQESFYVYGENIRMNHLGHIVGNQQNVVWGTGTHTSTPVGLIAYGPASATSRFSGLMHMTDVGKAMIAVVKGE